MNRRRLLVGGAAAVAAAAGAGLAVWRQRRLTASEPAPGSAAEALWALQLPQPGGGAELRLQPLRGRPVLVNFWATWCPPCVAELPLLDRFAQAHPGWAVVGLAVDQADAVRSFLLQHTVSYPIGLTGVDGLGLVRQSGNPSGGLPFSLVLQRDGAIGERKLGALGAPDLQAWAERAQ